jgi:manganese/zinc/iron transport system permease protein
MRRLDLVLTTLLVIAIVIGLQTVGVVLMSAILIAPAAAARQWSDRLGRMVLLAAGFGATAGIVGALISASTPRMPTGPTSGLCAGAIMLVSLLFAPGRGLVAEFIRGRRSNRNLRVLGVLEDLSALARQHTDPQHPHAAAVLRTMTSRPTTVEPGLLQLERRGWARRYQGTVWALTPAGWAAAEDEFGRRSPGSAESI